MRRRQKKCLSCHQLFLPHPGSYRQGRSCQKTCQQAACRAWRNRQSCKTYRLKNSLSLSAWQAKRDKEKKWRQAHAGYWKKWRKKHPGYVRNNRLMQRRRDQAQRRFLAKRHDLDSIHPEKTTQTLSINHLAKRHGLFGLFRRYVADLGILQNTTT